MNDDQETMERDLRLASDGLLASLDELYRLEDEKRTLTPGTPRFVELAGRVETLAQQVLGHSVRQGELAEQAEALVEQTDATPRVIEDVPPRPIHAILADWRQAERRASEAVPGSEDADRAATEITRLRDEYRRAHDRAAEHH